MLLEVDLSIPSPIATGGGGEHFEQHVAAFALGLLLVRATPPILTNTSVVEVHLQTKHLGWRTDDILLVGKTSDGGRRKLAVQVKRTFTVSANNDDCRKIIQGMWDDFLAGDQFASSTDQLAIVTLHGTSAVLRDFNSLLLCARATIDAADFSCRLSKDGYISRHTKEQNNAVQTILTEHAGTPLDEDLYWHFLRTVNVLSFDLNTSTSQTKASVLSLLSLVAVGTTAPLAAAKATWAKLLECASEGRPIAKSYAREDLPPELLERHSAVSVADGQGLWALFEHGKTVRDNIRSTIGHTYEIDRSSHVTALINQLADCQVVIVSGTAGSGKSALAKHLIAQIEPDRPVLAFQAVEFATAHIDKTLVNAQTNLNAQGLFAQLAGHDKKLILIESVERLLEHSIRDAFSHLLRLARENHSIQLVLTVRDYSLETVRKAFLEPIGLSHAVFEVSVLSDDELDQIQAAVPSLAPPLRDSQLRSFLRTPYVLDMASRLDWADSAFPASAREFREKCWRELIRADDCAAGSMPQRRERAFLDVAYRRATELRPFVQPGMSDAEALDALRRDSLVECSPDSSALFAAAHDVLEDWAILHWLDDQFAIADDSVSVLADAVGGYPALRLGFRRWLGERFEINPDDAREFVLRTLGQDGISSHFRDDCLVSVLLSETAGDFLKGCRPRLAKGDLHLLSQIIHMLRVACKESPHWLNVPALPSQMLVPTGAGWVPTLRLVSSLIDDLLPEHAQLILGFVEDWVRQVDWSNTAPDGFNEAGLIVDALLAEFDGYKFDNARKRVLEILVKIPHAVPQFGDIIERARTCGHDDRTASDLADLVLGSLSGRFVCRDFPAEVISLANVRLRLSEADLDRDLELSYLEPLGVDQNFGIREHGISEFFPASALQGPFAVLLLSHPREAVAFIVDLLNHAGDWYGTQRWPGQSLEPAWKITLEIPGFGAVEHWMNGRLYVLYRGMSVGPYALQSALMALESWLLSIGKKDDVDLEPWLLYILRESNNVMATSVVASVCVAYPGKAGRAGLALLSNREIVQCDRSRSASELHEPLEVFTGLNPSNHIYEQERKESNRLKHRREDLELLAVQMQLLTNLREDVWTIIDRHRSEIPTDPDEETRVWRLALHRMDIRGFRSMDPSEEVRKDANEDIGDQIYLGPGEIERDVQDMVDKRMESQAITNRHLRLLNQASSAWKDRNSNAAVDWRKMLLAEARAVEQELDEPDEIWRGGPGLVAAVCIRDHLDELDESDFQWCARRIEFEVRRNSDCPDDIVRHAKDGLKPDRAGASVVCLLAVHDRSAKALDALDLLSRVLTHPVDEVADYANTGVGAFLGDEHRELILRCAAAAAYRARLIAAFRDEEAKLPYLKRTPIRELFDRATPAVRQAIEDGGIEASVELASFDFDSRTSGVATSIILKMLCHHPKWEESRHFCSRIACWQAEVWNRTRQSSTGNKTRNYKLEQEVLRAIARFVLNLSIEEARRISAPLVDAVVGNPRGAADFLHELIMAAVGSTDDCFWDLWQDIANKAAGAPWTNQLERASPFKAPLIDRIFLGISWNDDVKHWERLDGHAHRLDEIAQRLPAMTPYLLAYSRFLYTIGQQSLPEAFKVVGSLLEKGDAVRMVSDSNIAFHLETLLRRFVYSEPHRLKSDSALRNAILGILDSLVAGGSSSAYRMRDDFVTPSAQASA